MIPLFLITGCWFTILLVVAALCMAARRGDRNPGSASPLSALGPDRLQDWESAEHLAVYAHAARVSQRGAGREPPPAALAGISGAGG